MQDWGLLLTEIRDFLNSETYSPALTISKSYLPKNDLVSLALTGYVFPSTDEQTLINRAEYQVNREVAIVITKKVDVGREDYADNLDDPLSVVAQVMDSMRDKAFTYYECISVRNETVYDFQKISENGIFQSLIIATVQGYVSANR